MVVHAIFGTSSRKRGLMSFAPLTNASAMSSLWCVGSRFCIARAGSRSIESCTRNASRRWHCATSESGWPNLPSFSAPPPAAPAPAAPSSTSSAPRSSLNVPRVFSPFLAVSVPGPSRTPKRKRPSKTEPSGYFRRPWPCSRPSANSPLCTCARRGAMGSGEEKRKRGGGSGGGSASRVSRPLARAAPRFDERARAPSCRRPRSSCRSRAACRARTSRRSSRRSPT